MGRDATYLFDRGVTLMNNGRDAEALSLFQRVVAVRADDDGAWWNLAMLYDRQGNIEHALDAYAAFVRFARPGTDAFVDHAVRTLTKAGRPVPESQVDRHTNREMVQLFVEQGDERTLLVAENDSGVEVDALQRTIREFLNAPTWLAGYMVMRDHPELLSSLSVVLLRTQAQRADTDEGKMAEQNLAVLQRVAEAGPEVAFGEAERLPPEDFRQLVRATDELGPAVNRLLATASREEQAHLLADSDLAAQPGAGILLWYLAQYSSGERKQAVEQLRALVEQQQ